MPGPLCAHCALGALGERGLLREGNTTWVSIRVSRNRWPKDQVPDME